MHAQSADVIYSMRPSLSAVNRVATARPSACWH